MKKTKAQRGITLVALIITIIVLLILAVVSIRAVQGDGIIQHAKNAKNEYVKAQVNEEILLQEYMNYLNEGIKVDSTVTVSEAQTKGVLSTTSNTDVYDEYGNKIVVPAGFKITTDANHVTEGIVIEDVSAGTETVGSQFVWIPVGTVYTNTEKTESKDIILGRYSWNENAATLVQPTDINSYKNNIGITNNTGRTWIEYQATSITNYAKAKDINKFYESASNNGGYYIGRYEGGDSGSTTIDSRTGSDGISTPGVLVCKANQVPYNWITQIDASNECKEMYVANNNFESDLVNSYAWDTAIIFIQIFGTKENSATYATTKGKSSIRTDAPQTTGTNILLSTNEVDEQLNIYDMAGNCLEWNTEISGDEVGVRGGAYSSGSSFYTAIRVETTGVVMKEQYVPRPILYLCT